MIISTQELDFSYQKKLAIKKLNLKVPQGSIYGFLGPNGAGKSTSIRLLLGLLSPESGSVSVFNKDFNKNRSRILSNIGVLIEAPAFYSHLNAYENLLILTKLREVSSLRIEEVLKIVSLTDVSKKKVKKFSMGMKQRLGIAATLLHDPEILILDEPTNGLDPQGIKDIRELLVNLNKYHQKTIFISSHILAEIEMIASHIGIIQNGELSYQNTIDDLQKNFAEQKITLKVTSDTKEEQLRKLPELEECYKIDEFEYSVKLNPNYSYNDFLQSLTKNEIQLLGISKSKHNLEDIFLKLTKIKIQ